MKPFIVITIFLLCIIQASQTQPDSVEKMPMYRTWIYTYDAPRVRSGDLYCIKDSSITVSKSNILSMDSPEKPVYSTINARLIDVIKIRKKEDVGLEILYGAISGLVVGGIVDLVYSIKYNPGLVSKTFLRC